MLAFLLGILLWTLLEYLLHRFVFHRYRGIVGSFHHEHHGAPRNLNYLFVRLPYSIGLSAVFVAAIWALTGDIVRTMQFMAGIWLGYIYYESVHYRVHFSPAEGGWIGHQRRAHFRHHFHNSRKWFGVTTPLWDYVFRTTSSD
jgi:hypothetical protein